ncbi:MAG: Integral membrane protein [uncultured Truepera sp.]|uniref:Integral membrane protein n=1 Tax=uncultured Truepera sp. TaxID=543023 RepID=A0A6J4UYX1_9DEIN|nr:MAG: Integral membrane protein [uncultured Truepera sp.]
MSIMTETRRDVAAPLCVDLDGTLIKTDLLFEMLLLLLKTRPLALFQLPLWLFKGKAHFKQELAARAHLDVTCLPYRAPLLSFLKDEQRAGRKLVLATAADARVARQVAAHLGIFSAVVASDGAVNCSGSRKLGALERECGPEGFVYVGDAPVDLQVWRHARGAILVGGGNRFVKQLNNVERTFEDDTRPWEALRAMRLHQWAKNVLIFVPLLLAHEVTDPARVAAALLAFLAFSLCASSVYVQNDLLDLEADRHHPRKRFRPFASGALPVKFGLLLAPALLALAVLAALPLSSTFLGVLGLYFVLTLSYSLYFKRKAILDVLLLAILYTVRIVAGGVAVGLVVSPWLLAFAMFFFLNLAYVKRFSELKDLPGESFLRARGYTSDDLEGLADLGVASGYVSILVVALYINSPEVSELYRTPELLWLLCPLLVYWVSRVWLLARRGQMHDDPVIFALRDRVSYVVGACAVLVGAAAAGGWWA